MLLLAQLLRDYLKQLKKTANSLNTTDEFRQTARHKLALSKFFIAEPAQADIPDVMYGDRTFQKVVADLPTPVIDDGIFAILKRTPEMSWAASALATFIRNGKLHLSRWYWPWSEPASVSTGLTTMIISALTAEPASADEGDEDEKQIAITLIKAIVSRACATCSVQTERFHYFLDGAYTKSDIAITTTAPAAKILRLHHF
ncbi:hypothetical protein HDU87_003565 [Geranomyces variabilis]|uniref:Uncharacterized protein n=1 Tax=Geranomyces variabilis TaxID=109894 RepID=A0AAD5XSJ3_9FUNG|nr:hypothetical protein HDU87_003565 [Geranomyces variabilis]